MQKFLFVSHQAGSFRGQDGAPVDYDHFILSDGFRSMKVRNATGLKHVEETLNLKSGDDVEVDLFVSPGAQEKYIVVVKSIKKVSK